MYFNRSREVQGLHRLRAQLPGRRDLRRGQEAARHRPEQVHQMRRLHVDLPLRRYLKELSREEHELQWITPSIP